jgi:hypothetical protein
MPISMKTCSHCQIEKDDAEFHPRREAKSKAKLASHCRTCRNTATAAWRVAHRPQRAAYQREWARRHPEKNAAGVRAWQIAQPVKYLFGAARTRAKKIGVPFTIVLADVVIPALCPVFGVPLQRAATGRGPNTPSLDRIDARRGYEPGNVWVISRRANDVKGDATPEELETVASAVRRKGALRADPA